MAAKPIIKLPGFPHLQIAEHGTFATAEFDSTNKVIPIVVAGFNKPTKKTPTGHGLRRQLRQAEGDGRRQ